MALFENSSAQGALAKAHASWAAEGRKEAWEWFEAHKEDVVFQVGFWKLGKVYRVRDLRFLFVLLFKEPVAA